MYTAYKSNKIFKKLLAYLDEHYDGYDSTVDAVSRCFFIIDSEVMEKIKFLDEKIFLYYEVGKKRHHYQ